MIELYVLWDLNTDSVYRQMDNMKKAYIYFNKTDAEKDVEYFMNTEKGKLQKRNLEVRKVHVN